MSLSSPSGMYPMDGDYLEEFARFADLRTVAEGASDILNFPISWTLYDETDDDWGRYVPEGDSDRREFTLTFLLPRKHGRTWALRTREFDRAEVQGWLNTWLRVEVNRWYGFDEAVS